MNLFYEQQTFEIWVWGLVGGIGAIMIGASFFRKLPTWIQWFLRIFGTLVPLVFLLFAGIMRTRVTANSGGHSGQLTVSFGYLEALNFYYSVADISSAQPQKYCPIAEFGGWGIRGNSRNRALNIRGDSGVQLLLADSAHSRPSRCLIGSERSSELADVLDRLLRQK